MYVQGHAWIKYHTIPLHYCREQWRENENSVDDSFSEMQEKNQCYYLMVNKTEFLLTKVTKIQFIIGLRG
jgi:hypothetical protein